MSVIKIAFQELLEEITSNFLCIIFLLYLKNKFYKKKKKLIKKEEYKEIYFSKNSRAIFTNGGEVLDILFPRENNLFCIENLSLSMNF